MKTLCLSCLFILCCAACNSSNKQAVTTGKDITDTTSVKLTAFANKDVASIITETFETGNKGSYAAGDVTLATGVWNCTDALLGTSSSDRKDGAQSARIRNSGMLSMEFNLTSGASSVTIKHAKYGTDGNSTWQLWHSINNGSTYLQTGTTITTATTTLQTASFSLSVQGNVRFQIRKVDGSANRLNIDDITITGYGGTAANAPVLSSLSPDTAAAGGSAFTLTAKGTNFATGATLNWNGAALPTTYVSNIQLSASVPAADITSAGTASVTVTTNTGTSTAVLFIIRGNTIAGAKKFLFDATKAETAGNADWVIDEDNNTPQRTPTPAQSRITSSTPETYWTGALSSWGIALVKAGDFVETLPGTGSITYGNSSNPQDLSHYDVFVVDEPNILFTATEKRAILTFIKNGGGLFMISDHTVSDRNNDGYDSPAIWNDLMTNNTVGANPFGFSIDLTNISELSSNVLSNSSGNVILHGSQGAVSQLQFNNGATITLQPSVNSSVQGLIWQSGVAQSTTHIMCASSTFGNGRVFVVTDSSPMDDGTGAPGNNLYKSWNIYSHTQLFMNASLWLAKQP